MSTSRPWIGRAVSLAVGLLSAGPVLAADRPQPASNAAIAAPFFFVNDNRLSYTFIPDSADAGYFTRRPNGTYDGKTSQSVLSFSHFDVWAYGTNFFTVGVFKADSNDPAGPCYNAGVVLTPAGDVSAKCAGATDVYGVIRSTFGFNEIFDTKAFKVGPLSDVSFEIGGDFEAQNTYFASAKKAFVAGLQFSFELPYKGFFNVAPLFYVEQGHNAYTQCGAPFANAFPRCNVDGNTNFNPTAALEINYYMDLGFLPQQWQYFSISGRMALIGPKGPFQAIKGNESTRTELNSEPIRLTMDLGRFIDSSIQPHNLDIFVAYRYWRNMYGDNENSAPFVCTVAGTKTNSCHVSSIATGLSVKF